jgi:hypothetical protein
MPNRRYIHGLGANKPHIWFERGVWWRFYLGVRVGPFDYFDEVIKY